MKKLSQEFEDLDEYFRLIRYRDETDYFLQDEYDKLEEIIKRSDRAKEMEKARVEFYQGKITEEQYKELCDSHYRALEEAKKEDSEVKIERKRSWQEYNSEEKTTLLTHWFYYYGGVIMTLKDMEDFRNLVVTRQDQIFNHIVTNYVFRDTIQSNLLVSAMRSDRVDELFSLSLSDEILKELDEDETIRRRISDEIIETFINPQPPVPMDIEVVVTGPAKRKRRKNKDKQE